MGPRKIVVDTDPGIDDFLALCLLFSCPPTEIQILGITIVHGNSSDMTLMARNACFAMQLCGIRDIPVVIGAASPLAPNFPDPPPLPPCNPLIHGPGLIGGVIVPDDVDISPLDNEWNTKLTTEFSQKKARENGDDLVTPAARFLVEILEKNPGEVTIVTLGSLTNVALASQLWTSSGKTGSLGEHVAAIYSMAGALHTHPGALGNRLPWSEANMVDDTFAAQLVLRMPRCPNAPHYLIPLDLTNRIGVSQEFGDQLVERLRKHGQEHLGNILRDMLSHYRSALSALGARPPHGFHDPTAVLFLLSPHLFAAPVKVSVDVETRGHLVAGATVADWNGRWGRERNVEVVLDVAAGCGAEGVLEEYLRRLEVRAAELPRRSEQNSEWRVRMGQVFIDVK